MAKKPGMKNNTFLWGLAAVLGLGVAGVIIALALNLIQTQTYYILKEDVPSRAEVTPDMLQPVTVNKGGAPEAAIGLKEVQSGGVYTSHPLIAGDILTASNVGGNADVSAGVPDNWVITSFSVPPESAVGGRIQKGYYFDMLVAGDNGSYYPFVNVLALDTSVDVAASAQGQDGSAAATTSSNQYVVGMSPENAAKLQQIMKASSSDVKLVLSPRQNEYQKPKLADYEGVFNYTQGDEPVNLGEGTDYTFTSLPRDAFGRPTQELKDCNPGNAVLSDDKACKAGDSSGSSSSSGSSKEAGSESTGAADANSGGAAGEEATGSATTAP